MPPPGGTRNSLSQMVAWLTSRAKPATQPNKAADKPVDVNQFKDAYQPDDGVFSPNLPLPPMDVQTYLIHQSRRRPAGKQRRDRTATDRGSASGG
jgi:hypothetical protein